MGNEPASRQSQLEEQINMTTKVVDELNEVILQLKDKLSPILADELPEPSHAPDTTAAENIVQRATQVRAMKDCITVSVATIQDIILRIEC